MNDRGRSARTTGDDEDRDDIEPKVRHPQRLAQETPHEAGIGADRQKSDLRKAIRPAETETVSGRVTAGDEEVPPGSEESFGVGLFEQLVRVSKVKRNKSGIRRNIESP